MQQFIYRILPNFIQNLLISCFNIIQYKKRYGGNYTKYLNTLKLNQSLNIEELNNIQRSKYEFFMTKVLQKSSYYKLLYKNIKEPSNLDRIKELPIISKEELRQHIMEIYTIKPKEGVASKTGGTTGKSLEVYYTLDNLQERFALLDHFRESFGYKLGKKTAWFSGKSLLTTRDIHKRRFWKTDYIHKVRYYSTFHIKGEYLKSYLENLIEYRPEYIVGFPSSIIEIARYGLRHNYDFPAGVIKAIFPTAETITNEMRIDIESFFKTRLYNQYASSEGAPFIFECKNGNLHLELQSGIFEVLDENNIPSESGRLVITSFTTEGTPLIRYDIGDTVILENKSKTCDCGNQNPLVKEIQGRTDDYIYSPERGKINLGNVSNTLKNTAGIIQFQVIQNEPNRLEILLITDSSQYNKKIENKFIENWKDRVGNNMCITLKYVNEIPLEKSGKFRIVKNNLK
ncbi:phenylacetate--CoA ligase family protein [Proteiniphilum sp.]|uniref:phenylacetate--CoA ligase family protein n=1 Tax=Proteiniphilum sp. TaxID=1926877 RepID=UPI0033278BCC